MKKGDLIFFEYDGDLRIDRINEIIEVDGNLLITPDQWDWVTLTEDDLLDDTDIRVQEYYALNNDKVIKLSDARNWLEYHSRAYYEASEWSKFDDEQLLKDFCMAMFKK